MTEIKDIIPRIIRISLTSLFIALFLPCHSMSVKEYHHTRDSLQNILEHSTGREKVDALFEFIRFIVPYETDTCEALIAEELDLAQKLGYETGLAKACQNRGDFYYMNDKYALALDDYFKAVNIFESRKQYKEAGDTYTRIVIIFYFNANPQKFELYNAKAIECYEKCQCWGDLATAHLMFGYYYNNFTDQPDQSKFHHRSALKYFSMTSIPPIYIAGTYVSFSLAFRPYDPDSSIFYLRKSFGFMKGDSDDEKLQRIIAYRDLGTSYYDLKDYDSARLYFDRSIREAESLSYNYIITSESLSFGRIY
jgi:tetratricopeptide (TPR) repeat protein